MISVYLRLDYVLLSFTGQQYLLSFVLVGEAQVNFFPNSRIIRFKLNA